MDDASTGTTDRDTGRGIIGRVAPLLGVLVLVLVATAAARSNDGGLVVIGRGALGARLLVGAFGLTVVVGLGIWVLGARSPLTRVVGALLFALTLFGLIWWIESDEALDEPHVEEVTETFGPSASADPGSGLSPPVIDTGTFLLIAALVGGSLTAIATHWLTSRRPRAGPGPPVTAGSPSRATLGARIAGTARAAAEELLTGEDPGTVVLRAWLAFETLLEGQGIGRRPGQTSREYVRNALLSIDAGAVDTDAVAELAALYDRAMYSSHPLGRPEAERAAAALRRVAAGLRTGTTAP